MTSATVTPSNKTSNRWRNDGSGGGGAFCTNTPTMTINAAKTTIKQKLTLEMMFDASKDWMRHYGHCSSWHIGMNWPSQGFLFLSNGTKTRDPLTRRRWWWFSWGQCRRHCTNNQPVWDASFTIFIWVDMEIVPPVGTISCLTQKWQFFIALVPKVCNRRSLGGNKTFPQKYPH